MIKIEALYKCRHCNGIFSVQDCVKVFTVHYDTGGTSFKIPLILESTTCPHCCLNTTNGATITVVADLIRQIRKEEEK